MSRRSAPAMLLVEVGCEELPPGAMPSVLDQLARDAASTLREARLSTGVPVATGTLRRLVLMVPDVEARQADRVTQVRGPAARIAYDPSGTPTQAAAGFARSQGVPLESLITQEIDGGRYVVAEVRETGRPAGEVLGEILPSVVAGLSFPKTMRWKTDGMRFGRPIRWVVALLDGRIVPMELAGLRAGRRSVGHRFLSRGLITLATAGAYTSSIRRAGVVLDRRERVARISDGAAALAAEVGGRPVPDEELLGELVWSLEHPTPLRGAFDPALASALPREIVLVTLQHHQKSFGVQDPDGRLLPAFIAVRDGGASHLEEVRVGHEWVVRARLEDARFFLEEDRRSGFDKWNEELSRLAHAAGLGSVADHVRRIQVLADWLGEAVGLSADERQMLNRAARLCKADLVTALVREFPSLQGVIGRIYALEVGEPPAVAAAIEEHYWPKSAGGPAPETRLGAALSIADRALLLVGAVLAGIEPTGSQDPYGLRRAASGIATALIASAQPLDLRALYRAAARAFDAPEEARERAAGTSVAFTLQRLRTWLLEQGIAYDTVDAVMATGREDVVDLVARARALDEVRGDAVMPRLATGFARASRILGQGQAAPEADISLLAPGAEQDLYAAWLAVRDDVERAASAGRFREALRMLERLADPIDRFFDDVLVMAPDPAVRANRLALLRGVTATFLLVADFGKLAG